MSYLLLSTHVLISPVSLHLKQSIKPKTVIRRWMTTVHNSLELLLDYLKTSIHNNNNIWQPAHWQEMQHNPCFPSHTKSVKVTDCSFNLNACFCTVWGNRSSTTIKKDTNFKNRLTKPSILLILSRPRFWFSIYYLILSCFAFAAPIYLC